MSRCWTAFLSFVLACYDVSNCAEFVQRVYTKLDNGEVRGSDPRELVNVQSLPECALLCQGVSDCSGIGFEAQRRTCYLYSWLGVTSSGDGAHGIWVSKDVKLFLASRQDGAEMSYSEAQDLCSSLGARLSNHLEVYEAYDAGFNMCRCGWTQGEIIRLILTVADPLCPDTYNSIGVFSCKSINTATDAFCRFN